MDMKNKTGAQIFKEAMDKRQPLQTVVGANSHCRLSSGSAQPAIELLTDVMDSHKDPNSPDFNDCLDGRECQWCVEAKEWIEAHKSNNRKGLQTR
jgi:hypothetical protein